VPKAVTSTLADRDHGLSVTAMAVGAIGFAAALAIAAQVRIPLPFTPVPITLQTFVLYLGAAWLGARVAQPGLAAYVTAALVGAPVLSGFRGGAGAFVGATGGYILGWFVAILVVGYLLDGSRRPFGRSALAMAAGSVIILSCGALHLMLLLGLDPQQAFLMGIAPFIPGDVIKILTASAIVSRWPNPLSMR
jgi:biotin transport system substrate-specific component